MNAAARLETIINNPGDHQDLNTANEEYDKMIMFQLNSFVAFCNISRELELPCCAMYEDPNNVGPDIEDHNYDYDYRNYYWSLL